MKKILNLINLEFKMNRKSEKSIINILSIVFTCLLIFGVSSFLSYYCLQAFDVFGDMFMLKNELSLIVLLLEMILFFYALSMQIKTIYLFKNKEIILYLPIDKKDIYLAKMIYSFIIVEIINLLISVPALVLFGLFNALGIKFYIVAFGLILLMPILPFALASLVSLPIVFVLNYLKNKNILKLILTIIAYVALLCFYMQIVFEIASIVLLKTNSKTNLFVSLLNFCGLKFVPSFWAAEILLGGNWVASLLLFVFVGVVFLAFGLILNMLIYNKILVSTFIEKISSKTIKTKSKKMGVFRTYFSLEMKEIFRKSNQLFVYVGMSCAMPFMVVFCNKFITEFATAEIGGVIRIGVTLFVVMMFVSIITSPVATLISKEGNSFWILKTNPNGIGFPLLAKTLVGFCFSGTSLVLTIVLACLLKQISWSYGLLICAIALMFIVLLIAAGLILNLSMPNMFNSYKEKTSNVLILLVFGLVCSIAAGMFAIIKSFELSAITILLICFASVSVLAIIAVVILFVSFKSLYERMEV